MLRPTNALGEELPGIAMKVSTSEQPRAIRNGEHGVDLALLSGEPERSRRHADQGGSLAQAEPGFDAVQRDSVVLSFAEN